MIQPEDLDRFYNIVTSLHITREFLAESKENYDKARREFEEELGPVTNKKNYFRERIEQLETEFLELSQKYLQDDTYPVKPRRNSYLEVHDPYAFTRDLCEIAPSYLGIDQGQLLEIVEFLIANRMYKFLIPDYDAVTKAVRDKKLRLDEKVAELKVDLGFQVPKKTIAKLIDVNRLRLLADQEMEDYETYQESVKPGEYSDDEDDE